MRKIFLKCITNRSGATAIEYALIALFIGVAAIVAMRAIGGSVSNSFTQVSSGFQQ